MVSIESISHLISSPIPTFAPTDGRRYDSNAAVEVVKELREKGNMFGRALGSVAYVMVSPMTSAEACHDLVFTVEGVVRVIQSKSESSATQNDEIV